MGKGSRRVSIVEDVHSWKVLNSQRFFMHYSHMYNFDFVFSSSFAHSLKAAAIISTK